MGTVNLIKGTIYRGRVIISAPSFLVTRSAVKEALEGNGFSNATVWLDEDDIPSDWPSSAREDVSSTMSSLAWIEAGWAKETGDYPSSGSKWKLYDYWVQQTTPVVDQPPPPKPEEEGPPLELECVTEGMNCTQIPCCSGTTCQQDYEGYWGGGPRCMVGSGIGPVDVKDEPPPQPMRVNDAPKTSPWWWVAGAAGVLGAAYLLWPKTQANPARTKAKASEPHELGTAMVRKHADAMPAPGPWRVEKPLVPVPVLARYGDIFVHRFPEFYEFGHLDEMWVLSTDRPGEGYKQVLICFTEKSAFATAKYIGQGSGKKLLDAVYVDIARGLRSIHDSEAIREFDHKIRAYAWKHR